MFCLLVQTTFCKTHIPGLAVGESMDLDSLLPPALSESLHIPPWLPWLLEAQARAGFWFLWAASRQTNTSHKQTQKETKISHSVRYFQNPAVTQIFQTQTTWTLLLRKFPWLRSEGKSMIQEDWRTDVTDRTATPIIHTHTKNCVIVLNKSDTPRGLYVNIFKCHKTLTETPQIIWIPTM